MIPQALIAIHMLIALLALLIIGDTFQDWFALLAGSSFSDYLYLLFIVLVILELLGWFATHCGKWRAELLRPLLRTAVAGTCGMLLVLSLGHLFGDILSQFRQMRIATAGRSGRAVLHDFTEWEMFYPRTRFLDQAREVIPPDEAVLVFGNMRPDPINYDLYPRPVYALPELQQAELLDAMFKWSDRPDPRFPDGRPAELTRPGYDEEAIRRELEQLIEERRIRWVVHPDLLDPDAFTLTRIPQR